MSAVSGQIKLIPGLRRSVEIVRRRLKSLGLESDFDGLLLLWDVADDKVDFARFSKALTAFIPKMLKALALSHPFADRAEVVDATIDDADLTQAALHGTIKDEEVPGWDFEEARVEVTSMLEQLRWFESPENLVSKSDLGCMAA